MSERGGVRAFGPLVLILSAYKSFFIYGLRLTLLH